MTENERYYCPQCKEFTSLVKIIKNEKNKIIRVVCDKCDSLLCIKES